MNRRRWLTYSLLIAAIGLVVAFVALGNWQLRRLDEKLSLINAVETRAFGQPVELPQQFYRNDHNYLRVTISGDLAQGHILVKAVTDLGPGYWVMRPLQSDHGTIWINQGFIPPDQKNPDNWLEMPENITGLLRPTVPNGTLLERNRPNRWVSRDTHAMAKHLTLPTAVPYFIDMDHSGSNTGWPRGGMTKIVFANSHLSYALTWYAMALIFAIVLGWLIWNGEF